ncbi:2-oxoglutarate and iron-dependent oxygenase domain-containing protein [Streptomyces sp. NPDC048196]|uniref:2-oxoglutarate and iron-dependent oxygenase domain-containing protein n=1 Tax=Streptomyces sp. NPDC048196 TaxID=3154712 RepID=UPI0033F406D4
MGGSDGRTGDRAAPDVPVIDISGWENGTEAARTALATAVDRAARTVGFLQIRGHGIPEEAAEPSPTRWTPSSHCPWRRSSDYGRRPPASTAATPRRAPRNSA